MGESRVDFKNANDWEKRYRPIQRCGGASMRCNGTLFARQGEDRKFVAKMEREFIWSVFNNGRFEYLQAGRSNDSNVIGYLLTDNPVLFADLNSKFAIQYHAIDWASLERQCDCDLATEDVAHAAAGTLPCAETQAQADQPVDTGQHGESEQARPAVGPTEPTEFAIPAWPTLTI